MEKFYIVTEESRLHKDYYEYLENRKVINELYKSFVAEHGIEASEYYVSDDSIYIVPTETDKVKFLPILAKPLGNGLQKFKASSRINKSWIAMLKENKTKVLRKPMLILYMKTGGGKFSSRLFDQDGTLYCSIDPSPKEHPVGFIEIKGSAFYKILESSDESVPA